MARQQFFGSKLKVTEEVAQQYKIANEAIVKLTDMSRLGWHLIEDGCYKREMAGAAFIGGICTAAGICVCKKVKKIWKKHQDKQKT